METKKSVTLILAPVLALALAGPALAQDAHVGLGLALSVPTGRFDSSSYSPAGQNGVPSRESYDPTLGGQFTVSFPVDPRLALRLDVYGQSSTGKDTAPGYVSYNLQHDLLSLGGELQFFPGPGDAFRHRGAYLVGGLSLDLERFRSGYDNPDGSDSSVNRTRLGGLVGAGYSFRAFGPWRSNVEVAFHRTLNGNAGNDQPDPYTPATPPADFLRLTYGIVF